MPRHKDEVVVSASVVVVVANEVVMGTTDRHSPSHVIGHRSGPSGLMLHKAGTTKKVAQNGISSAQGVILGLVVGPPTGAGMRLVQTPQVSGQRRATSSTAQVMVG